MTFDRARFPLFNGRRTLHRIALVWVAVAHAALFTGCAADDPAAAPCHKRASQIGLGASVNLCPSITSLDVLPRQAALGRRIELTATATDPEGSEVVYLWSSSVDLVADSKSAHTTYLCSSPGDVTLTLIVSDGLCDDTTSTTITCGRCDGSADGGRCDGGATD